MGRTAAGEEKLETWFGTRRGIDIKRGKLKENLQSIGDEDLLVPELTVSLAADPGDVPGHAQSVVTASVGVQALARVACK